MPISIGNNLTLEKNKISGTYDDLFKKLNVACGWTNTQTTSSGGTAVVLVNDGVIISTIECDNINKCNCGKGLNQGNTYNCDNTVINGKLYRYYSDIFQQYGSKSDYVISTGSETKNFAIDTSGKLWYINNSTETQIGDSTNWSSLGYMYNGTISCGLNDGKIYLIESTGVTQKNTDLTNVSNLQASWNGSSIQGFCLNNNYLYWLNNNTSTLIGENNNWIDIEVSTGNPEYALVLNSNSDLYYVYQSNLYKLNISNVKKAVTNGSVAICITNNDKLYYLTNLTTKYGDNYCQLFNISNGLEWTDISRIHQGYNYFYGIGDEKLYKIKATSSIEQTVYTQIGTESNYQKVEGYYTGTTENNVIGIAWSGDAISVKHTVYTTKSPQVNDVTYSDNDLKQYSTITAVGTNTITDEFRTYERDITKDSSFTAIPPATIHETVSTIDFLRITNPNT